MNNECYRQFLSVPTQLHIPIPMVIGSNIKKKQTSLGVSLVKPIELVSSSLCSYSEPSIKKPLQDSLQRFLNCANLLIKQKLRQSVLQQLTYLVPLIS